MPIIRALLLIGVLQLVAVVLWLPRVAEPKQNAYALRSAGVGGALLALALVLWLM